MDYYILLGISRKDYKIISIRKERRIIEVKIKNKKDKVRCPECNKFIGSVHSKLKPIRSKYLDSCGERVNLIIYKRRFQ